jgi:hypothetical protein
MMFVFVGGICAAEVSGDRTMTDSTYLCNFLYKALGLAVTFAVI